MSFLNTGIDRRLYIRRPMTPSGGAPPAPWPVLPLPMQQRQPQPARTRGPETTRTKQRKLLTDIAEAANPGEFVAGCRFAREASSFITTRSSAEQVRRLRPGTNSKASPDEFHRCSFAKYCCISTKPDVWSGV